jgi:hypothetical protein
MLNVVIDGQCVLPGLPGSREVADGVVREGDRLIAAIAEFPQYGKRTVVARGGFAKLVRSCSA